MKTSIAVIVVFLILVFVFGFPTRRRAERAYTAAVGPHPLLRPFRALGRWQRERRKRRRRRHLHVHRD